MNIASTQIHPATSWAEAHLHEPIHIDCTTTVMLKILDGKCKMDQQEKGTIALMYDVIKHRPGQLLDDSHHQLIDKARQGMNKEMVLQVYEQRLYAETMITRPVMKTYKSMLRSEGLIN